MSSKPSNDPVLATNRKARHNYHILDTLEAGIALCGTEVKAIRNHELSIEEAFAVEHKGEVFLHNLHVRAYSHGNRFNHEPVRIRKLLLHKREIRKLAGQLSQEGLTLVPLDLHLRRGKIKVQLGIAKGKNQGDKRETLKKREADRDARRALSEAQRR
ncbi:MAG: SsrA-binding protein SmpB [Verrucomicrobia bacterium]|nr:SsrA-binding protein SmpB [Verrucomicrobiota bacterium]MCH8511094.1 SsrA-binding protein SmpB [Kiritimatiellia bacterium]